MISTRSATEFAKQLIGQWPHAKPADPEIYAASIAAVLAQYPLGVVQECCDPRRGLARGREFSPTVACLVEWLEHRLAHHRSLAAWRPPVRQLEQIVSEEERAIASRALKKLFMWLKAPKEVRGDPPTWQQAANELTETSDRSVAACPPPEIAE